MKWHPAVKRQRLSHKKRQVRPYGAPFVSKFQSTTVSKLQSPRAPKLQSARAPDESFRVRYALFHIFKKLVDQKVLQNVMFGGLSVMITRWLLRHALKRAPFLPIDPQLYAHAKGENVQSKKCSDKTSFSPDPTSDC